MTIKSGPENGGSTSTTRGGSGGSQCQLASEVGVDGLGRGGEEGAGVEGHSKKEPWKRKGSTEDLSSKQAQVQQLL